MALRLFADVFFIMFFRFCVLFLYRLYQMFLKIHFNASSARFFGTLGALEEGSALI